MSQRKRPGYIDRPPKCRYCGCFCHTKNPGMPRQKTVDAGNAIPDLWREARGPKIMVIAFIIWLACGIAGAIIGAQKGVGCGGFILGFLLGPIGLVIVLVMEGDRRKCPYCRSPNHKDATICASCRRPMDAAVAGSGVHQAQQPQAQSQQPQPQVDIADQIRKLAELKEIGAITEYEFETKKRELLSKM